MLALNFGLLLIAATVAVDCVAAQESSCSNAQFAWVNCTVGMNCVTEPEYLTTTTSAAGSTTTTTDFPWAQATTTGYPQPSGYPQCEYASWYPCWQIPCPPALTCNGSNGNCMRGVGTPCSPACATGQNCYNSVCSACAALPCSTFGCQGRDTCNFATGCCEPISVFDSLMDFFFATNGTYWNHIRHWGNKLYSPCHWYGIECDAGSNVIAIMLQGNSLSGTLPRYLRLPYLKYLDVGFNGISGDLNHLEWDLNSLIGISFVGNSFNGTMPSFAWMKAVSIVNLADNNLTGGLHHSPFPLSQNATLTTLLLAGNQFTGSFPNSWSPLANSMLRLDVSRNSISGVMACVEDWPISPTADNGTVVFNASSNKLIGVVNLLKLNQGGASYTVDFSNNPTLYAVVDPGNVNVTISPPTHRIFVNASSTHHVSPKAGTYRNPLLGSITWAPAGPHLNFNKCEYSPSLLHFVDPDSGFVLGQCEALRKFAPCIASKTNRTAILLEYNSKQIVFNLFLDEGADRLPAMHTFKHS